MKLIFGFITWVLVLKVALGGVCPAANLIEPCRCTNITIDCSSQEELDLNMVFEAIAHGKHAGSDDLAFETFILNNSKISKLEDSVFHGVIFQTIKLQDCVQLSCVSSSAFSEMANNLTTFISVGTSFKSVDSDCNVFEAFKVLYNLETIHITKSQIREIPANAFAGKLGPLKALKIIDLSGGQGGDITKLGKSAFSSLKNLEHVDLSYHKIDTIDSFVFSFLDPNRLNLVIDLSHNNLTEKSFGVEAFQVNDRTTQLILKANPKIQVLSETVFQPFLINRMNETQENVIDLTMSPLKCSAGNVWLLDMVLSLRLKSKLKNAQTPDGESFWRHTKNQCAKSAGYFI